ncbi:hypothetical protein OROGR_009322 [Orobanche gracilis]
MSSVIGDDWDEEMMVMRPIFVPKSERVTIEEESTRIQVEGWKREAEKKIMEIKIQRDDDVNEGERERKRESGEGSYAYVEEEREEKVKAYAQILPRLEYSITMAIAREVASVTRLGIGVAIVVGGGNIFCGQGAVALVARPLISGASQRFTYGSIQVLHKI